MKTYFRILFASLLIGTGFFGEAQNVTGQQTTGQTVNVPAPTPYAIKTQDGSSRIWERTTYETSSSGVVVPHKHSYTELATGLNHLVNGQWLPSSALIEILPGGIAVATNGQHQAYFPGDIYSGQIEVVTPDGVQMFSRPMGLAYYNGTNSVLIAELTNSIGVVVGSNVVVYPDAFTDFKADLRYTYTKAGFEQDVILKERPPTPGSFGLDPKNTRLEVLTEFFDTTNPVQTTASVNAQAGLSDHTLTFGQMKMVPGRAFVIGDSASPPSRFDGVKVYKSWEHMEGRTFLVEDVSVPSLATQLEQLPLPANTTVSMVDPVLHKVSATRLLSPLRLAQTGTNTVHLAKADLHYKSGVVLDYVTLDSTVTDQIFQGDTTYYIDDNLSIEGYAGCIIEGGSVIKFAPGAALDLLEPLSCETSPYRPAILTAVDDNTVGETIAGSTGSPTGYYASYAIGMDSEALTPFQNLRIEYASIGLIGNTNVVDCQFVHDGTAIYTETGYLKVENVLLDKVDGGFFAYGSGTIDAEFVTAHNVSTLLSSAVTLSITNSLFIAVTNWGAAFNGAYNATNASDNGVFQIVGAGSHYLATNSIYRNIGTTSIDPVALADIQAKTTRPPIVYSDVTLSAATLPPQIPRDTNAAPDLGYHYDPLDYAFGGCVLSTNLTFTPGTVVGWYEDYGSAYCQGQPYAIALNNGANLTFNGTATQPCVIVRNKMVQEGNGNWLSLGFMGAFVFNGSGSGSVPQINAQFSKWFALPAEANHFRDSYGQFGTARLLNSELYGAGAYTIGEPSYYFTNCLFYRSGIGLGGLNYNASLNLLDCSFWYGNISLARYAGQNASYWVVKNTAFDGTTISTVTDGLGTGYTTFDYNAFLSGSNTLETVGTHDQTNIVSFNWQSSWFGDYYLTNSSPLIDAGSTTANLLGLYHFTTQTNQTVEGTSQVDIGYHYVATDAYGNPLDSNGNGIPDYLEDANGDGLVNNGETPWSLAITAQPTNQTAYVGDNVTFSVAATGLPPISYQWQFNGTNLPGATSATLTLNVVQTNNAGNYSVIVSNAQWSTNSTNAYLTVLLPSYTVLYSAQTNYTFRGDTTYYIAGTVNLYGTNNILEGGAVLKYAAISNAVISVSSGAILNCQTAPYRPAIFTGKDDNSTGLPISGSTGNLVNYYGGSGLSFGSSNAPSLHNLRMICLTTGITDAGATNSIRDVQFVNCHNGIGYTGSATLLTLENVLVHGGSNAVYQLSGGEGSISCVNCTFHNAFIPTNAAYLALTNCLVAGSGSPAYTGVSNAILSNDAGVFQTVGAGVNYLATNSIYRNAGTTNIDPVALADIQAKTTYPPTLFSNVTTSVNTTFSPQVQRDTDTPDIGYHYDPLDYITHIYQVTNSVQLTINAGTAIAGYNTAGIWLQDNSSIVSIGTPLNPNWFVRYSSVQEQPILPDGNPSGGGWPVDPYHYANAAPNGTYRFSKFACPAGGGYHLYNSVTPSFYANLLVQDCEFWGGQNLVGGAVGTVAVLKNNLFVRSTFTASVTIGITNSSLSASNNLFWNLTATVHPVADSNSWSFFNNDFDSSTILSGPGSPSVTINSYNAYFNCVGQLNPTNSTDLFGTNALAFQTGTLGTFYQPIGSPLINAGSTNANLVSLYHYTTQTNQMTETNSVVDIGYHYVATDAYGKPLDRNGDGIPDYWEDANGNGVVDGGEANWALAILTQPTNQVVIAGQTIVLGISVSGIGPFSYQWLFNGTVLVSNIISTVAGNYGLGGGYSGDGGIATNAAMNYPGTVAVDGLGNLYIADSYNNVIRKMTASGIISTVAGRYNLGGGYSGDGGAAVNAALNQPWGVTVDGFGNLYIADSDNNVIRKVNTNSIITTVAGTGSTGYTGDGGAATNATLSWPGSVAVDNAGNLYFADSGNSVIREVDTNGIITTVAGNGSFGYSGDGGAATSATLDSPWGITVDNSRNLYFADFENNVIRKVDTNGIITTVAGNFASFGYFGGHSGDGGAATNAALNWPNDVAVDNAGNLYIDDYGNNLIRKVDTRGVITTVAGNFALFGWSGGYSGDGGSATNAALNEPSGAVVDSLGNLYIADSLNNVIREVTANYSIDGSGDLTINNAQAGLAGNYQLVVANAYGSFTNSGATLRVVPPQFAGLNFKVLITRPKTAGPLP